MSVKVRIPSPLRSYTQGADVVEAAGSNVGEVLNGLKANASGIETRLFKAPNQLNRFVNVYLNDEDIRFLKNLDTPVKPGDEISIVPAIAGGSSGVATSNVIVRIPSMMRPHCENEQQFETEAGTVRDILARLISRYPALKTRIQVDANRVNRNLNIFLNDENIQHAGGLDAEVRPGDEVSLISGIAGG